MGRRGILWRDVRGAGLERLVLDASNRAVVVDAVVIAGGPEGLAAATACAATPAGGSGRLSSRSSEAPASVWTATMSTAGDPTGCPALRSMRRSRSISRSRPSPIRCRSGGSVSASAGRPRSSPLYVAFPSLAVAADGQRYTRLGPTTLPVPRNSLDSDFVRDIEVDEDGLVLQYPGLFERIR